jgi:hypothetical protein
MEQKPVQEIFGQRPEEYAEEKKRDEIGRGHQRILNGPDKEKHNHGKIENNGNTPVDMGEDLHEIALEQTS